MKRLAAGLLFLAFHLVGCSQGNSNIIDDCLVNNGSIKEAELNDPNKATQSHINQKIFAEKKFVYLTFDDGPSTNTEKILDILAEYDIKATFFVVGYAIQVINQSEAILNRMQADGHYIGLHSMTHDKNYIYHGENAPQCFMDEMLELQALIKDMTGGFTSQLCRAPYGTYKYFTQKHIDLILNSSIKCWDWNIDTYDWNALTVETIMSDIKEGLEFVQTPNCLVVLFHEKDITVEALPTVIDYYVELGYEFLPYHPDFHFPLNLISHPEL